MADSTKKKAARKKKAVKSAPDRLELSLFAPGMSPMHRAGLGGLACTLDVLEERVGRGQIAPDGLPGGPWDGGAPPWEISTQQIVLYFGQPDKAAEFLQRLFRFAFGIHEGLIFLPGQYGLNPPGIEVRAYLQRGLTLTFLQHGKSRKLAKDELTKQYQPEEGKTVSVPFKECTWFKHQDGWKDLVDQKKGTLTAKAKEVVGPLSPGAVVRHVAFSTKTRIVETPDRLLPLYFALVGCVSLSINRGCGVLVVPEVEDLLGFVEQRPSLTPQTAAQCQITSLGDAALQAQNRVRRRTEASSDNPPRKRPRPLSAGTRTQIESSVADLALGADFPGCHTSVFQPTTWASQQKSRVRTLLVEPANDEQISRLGIFETAIGSLAPRVATRVVKKTSGRGKNKDVTEHEESFWSDSVVRPLVADNLARGQPWYADFVGLMTRIDPVSKKPIRDRIGFEKEGLYKMTEQQLEGGESAVVRAIHTAIRQRYAQIAEENKKNPVAMKNRWKGEYDKWRLAFAGAKTPDQFRTSLCDLFSRAGSNSVLQADWQQVVPLLKDNGWKLTRDLALLGLASYSGKGGDEVITNDDQNSTES